VPENVPSGIARVRADNPSPLTLDGTNTYVVDRWVVDPGPDDPAHLDAVVSAAGERGIEGIVLTHGHYDHAEGAGSLAALAGDVPVVRPSGDEEVGPFVAVATPGHSPDGVSLVYDRACFSGDTVLGEGSVFVGGAEGSMSAYMDSLHRLRELDLEVLCPGHGPFVWEPRAKIDEYIEHRLGRERRIVDALNAGVLEEDEILDRAWSDTDLSAHPLLREAARQTLQAHLAKLRDEGRLSAS
jgi:glyoxylase-like metal-dependent hydrolase (beta-lactamase superfamily II)